MAVERETTWITDTDIIGFPGQNIPPSRPKRVSMKVIATVYDDGSCEIRVQGTAYGLMNGTESGVPSYHTRWLWNRVDFAIKCDPGMDTKPYGTNGAMTARTEEFPIGSKYDPQYEGGTCNYKYDFNFRTSVGSFEDFQTEVIGGVTYGILYLGCTGDYYASQGIYTDPKKIYIPEWDALLSYFPWARYQTLNGESAYWSHNRKTPTTGSLQRVSASKWTDVKNNMPENQPDNNDKGFRHNGTKFVKSPKEGKNK